MTLKQIEYAIKIAECGSINKAAKQLYVSQSVLSTAIRSLENELGQELFIRKPQGIELTPFGKAFITYANPVDTQMQLLNSFLHQTGGKGKNSLSIISNGFVFLHPMVTEIYRNHIDEGIQIGIRDGSSYEVLASIANGTADLGLACVYDHHLDAYLNQAKAQHVTFHELSKLKLAVMVGPQNPLYYQKEDFITPDQLAPYPAVMYGYMDAGPFSDISRRIGLKSSNSRFYSNSRATMYESTMYSDAFYLNSDYRVCPIYQKNPSVDYPDRRTLLLKDCPIENHIGWLSKSDVPLSSLEQEMVDKLIQNIVPEKL